MDQLGQPSFGLFNEACDQCDSPHVVAEPDTPTVGERGNRVIDEVEGVLAAARTWRRYKRSNGTRCVLATAMEYGCVAYALNTKTQSWAGGRGPDTDSAIADASSKLPPFTLGDVIGGGWCSKPVTPP